LWGHVFNVPGEHGHVDNVPPQSACYQIPHTVILDEDQPAEIRHEWGTIVLHPVNGLGDSSHKPAGTSEPDRKFSLTPYTTDAGAPVGEYAVTVDCLPKRKSLMEPEQPDRLGCKPRYAKKSRFNVTIAAKPNELSTIKLP
jgi:hypothetical protein